MAHGKGDLPTRDGQRVRVVLEGLVSQVRGDSFNIGAWEERNMIESASAHVVSIEVLPAAPAPWQAGDAVRVDGGTAGFGTALRLDGGRWQCSLSTCAVTHTDEDADHWSQHGRAVVLVRGGIVQPQAETR